MRLELGFPVSGYPPPKVAVLRTEVFFPLKHYVRNRPKLDKKYEIKQKYMHTSFDSAVSNTNSSYQAISRAAARKYNYYHKEVGWCNS